MHDRYLLVHNFTKIHDQCYRSSLYFKNPNSNCFIHVQDMLLLVFSNDFFHFFWICLPFCIVQVPSFLSYNNSIVNMTVHRHLNYIGVSFTVVCKNIFNCPTKILKYFYISRIFSVLIKLFSCFNLLIIMD